MQEQIELPEMNVLYVVNLSLVFAKACMFYHNNE